MSSKSLYDISYVQQLISFSLSRFNSYDEIMIAESYSKSLSLLSFCIALIERRAQVYQQNIKHVFFVTIAHCFSFGDVSTSSRTFQREMWIGYLFSFLLFHFSFASSFVFVASSNNYVTSAFTYDCWCWLPNKNQQKKEKSKLNWTKAKEKTKPKSDDMITTRK